MAEERFSCDAEKKAGEWHSKQLDGSFRKWSDGVTSLAIVVFVLVYLGMGLGSVPGLALDRTGIAYLVNAGYALEGNLALVSLAVS